MLGFLFGRRSRMAYYMFRWLSSLSIISFLLLPSGALAVGGGTDHNKDNQLNKIQHIVIIYEENHSFDNLFGGWRIIGGRYRFEG